MAANVPIRTWRTRPRNRFGGSRNRAQTSPAYGIRSRRASAARSTCLVINVTVSIIARSPHPKPKTALAPKAPRGATSSQTATAASPATAARHSIKLVEDPPRSAIGANASNSAISIAVPTMLPPFRSAGVVATVSRRHSRTMPPSQRLNEVAIKSTSSLAKRGSRSSPR